MSSLLEGTSLCEFAPLLMRAQYLGIPSAPLEDLWGPVWTRSTIEVALFVQNSFYTTRILNSNSSELVNILHDPRRVLGHEIFHPVEGLVSPK